MLLRFVVLVALYVAGAALATGFIVRPDQVTFMWPPAGLGYAALLLYGVRWWPFIAVAMVIVHTTFSPVPATFVPFSLVANALGAALGAFYVRRFRPDAIETLTVRSGFWLLLGGLIMVAVSAAAGVAGLLIAGMVPRADWAAALATWSLGDLFGAVAVTPAVVLAAKSRDVNFGRARAFRFGGPREKLIWSVALVGALVSLSWAGGFGSYVLGLTSLPLALLLWSAIRFEPWFTAVSTAVASIYFTSMVGLGVAGFEPPTAALDSAILIIFMVVIAVIPQMVAAAIHENRLVGAKLIQRATVDGLTHLANRAAFEQRTRELLRGDASEPMALAYLDLDQFKLVNDSVSHAAGDELLVGIAGVLRAALQPEDLLARIGGDEFAVLLRRCTPERAETVAQSLRSAVASFRFASGDHVIAPSVSIGVVPFWPGQIEFAALLTEVDTACFTAKEMGGNRVQLATPGEGAVLERTTAMRWAMRLNRAIDDNHFRLYCQRITTLGRRPISGKHYEILLRLSDPATGELIPPSQFVAAAERFNLGVRLDRYVLDRTLAWLETHPQAAADTELCSINLTAASVVDEDFAAFVQQRLAASTVQAHRLCFEITETSAVRDLARAQGFIRAIRALGCRFALDDFGTGFCSFAYLQSLDVDYFKIDGSFVRELQSSALSLAVVRSIADIARVLKKQTVAEYVEVDALRGPLLDLGVDFAQGYAVHRPESIETFFAPPDVIAAAELPPAA